MCPPSAHRRRGSHQLLGDARHSTQPSPLGFEAGLIPRKAFFIWYFPLNVACPATSSSHQQDLPYTALFCRCLRLGRFTEWQFLANRNYQLAISHRLGHGLERFPVEFREHVNHSYRRVLRSVLRQLDNRCIHSSGLDLGDQFLGGSSADRIRHRIEWRKIRNRSVVVGRDHLIRAHSLRLVRLPLQNSRDHCHPAFLRSEYSRTPHISNSTYDENRLARFDSST